MDYETILSTFDKRITLLQWLKQLTELLKDIKTEETVTADSVNPVESKGIYTFVMDNIAILRNGLETAIASKQDILMSGQNIKTVNGNSLLGAGDIQIQAGGAGVQVLKFVQGDPMAQFDNVKLPCYVLFVDTEDNPINMSIVTYDYGGSTTVTEADSGTTYEVSFDSIVYDEASRSFTCSIAIDQQS